LIEEVRVLRTPWSDPMEIVCERPLKYFEGIGASDSNCAEM
jgi:hypothetical protein